MAGHEGSNHELSLFAVAVAAAACVFAAAVNYVAAASKDDIAKASVIGSLQIAHSQRARNNANPTGPSAIAAAFAQATNTKPTPTAPLDSAPGENVSKKLNQSNGVVHPRDVDPGIEKPAPKTGDPNVAPPLGTSGGAPTPQPK